MDAFQDTKFNSFQPKKGNEDPQQPIRTIHHKENYASKARRKQMHMLLMYCKAGSINSRELYTPFKTIT